ncbi:hypothetical protein SAMN04488021_12747 [Paracoccus aminovorans]|uniref:Uncharacterized protein n=2 Tax=Paracoccus aminovorans TaxID=34004 RepID=A0A1I3C441_9RHOB|nr:hypothetical protein JCM7685_1891 [Paracoccus aminovorans]SFH69378.1 hypothetical protein SAMN04488021_12747 [Paracoccus aminovorans]
MLTAISQARGDMPAGPDPVSVALEAAVKNDRAVAMIRASWILAERWTGHNYWPVLGATARAQVDVAGDVAWPREPFSSALIVERWEAEGWGEVDGGYVPEFGLLVGLAPGRYRIRQTVPVAPEDPPEHVLESVRALALYQLIHSAARREFRTMGTGESSLTREALDGLFRASGAGILLAGEARW